VKSQVIPVSPTFVSLITYALGIEDETRFVLLASLIQVKP
jgi:hypothetical protein